jgi:hypothetical protein
MIESIFFRIDRANKQLSGDQRVKYEPIRGFCSQLMLSPAGCSKV